MWGLIKEKFNFLNLNLSTGEFIALDSFDAILTFLIGAGIIIGGVSVGIWGGFENIKKLFKKDEGYKSRIKILFQTTFWTLAATLSVLMVGTCTYDEIAITDQYIIECGNPKNLWEKEECEYFQWEESKQDFRFR